MISLFVLVQSFFHFTFNNMEGYMNCFQVWCYLQSPSTGWLIQLVHQSHHCIMSQCFLMQFLGHASYRQPHICHTWLCSNPVCMVHTTAEYTSCPWSVPYQQHSNMCSSCHKSRTSWQKTLTGTSLPMVSADNRVEAGWWCFHFTCALSCQITAALPMAFSQYLGCL